jgi:hypothetical protein
MASGVLPFFIGTLSEDRYTFMMPVCMRQTTVNQVHVVPDILRFPTCLYSGDRTRIAAYRNRMKKQTNNDANPRVAIAGASDVGDFRARKQGSLKS